VKLVLPASLAMRLTRALRRAGAVETGGLLMGEQLAVDEFRIVELSRSRRGGSVASFTRDLRHHRSKLERFFQNTGRDFNRFNYLGEWHSHPGFAVAPSGPDVAAMQAIVNDAAVGATFAVLLIVRLREDDVLEMGPYVFLPGKGLPYPVPLSLQPDEARRGLDILSRGGGQHGCQADKYACAPATVVAVYEQVGLATKVGGP